MAGPYHPKDRRRDERADPPPHPHARSHAVSDRLETLRSMLESEPDDPFLRYGMGFELAKLGRHEEAAAWFDRTLEIDPDHHYAAFQKARALEELGRAGDGAAIARAQGERAARSGDAKAASELLALAEELEDIA